MSSAMHPQHHPFHRYYKAVKMCSSTTVTLLKGHIGGRTPLQSETEHLLRTPGKLIKRDTVGPHQVHDHFHLSFMRFSKAASSQEGWSEYQFHSSGLSGQMLFINRQ
ncbi:hypothetical protein Tcan_10473 [Toxocara canis]|uniref:Uncharacterized protein n=1 Tax=Toxocara canis TaxID=6265 RepID=A0A0B2V120_TOXCA|nr:hypothetical protein Tcan_10473 [Toxocara canis]